LGEPYSMLMRVSIVLYLTLFVLTACASSTNIKDDKVTDFLNQIVSENLDVIQRAELEKTDIVYLTVLYSLKTDKLDILRRDEIYQKTRNFILSEETKASIVKNLGKGDPERLFNEGFSIRFQKPKSETYWVYSIDHDGSWKLIEGSQSE
jgi:hypothetical protein